MCVLELVGIVDAWSYEVKVIILIKVSSRVGRVLPFTEYPGIEPLANKNPGTRARARAWAQAPLACNLLA